MRSQVYTETRSSVYACEVMLACEVKEKQIKNQGRVSLARVPACEVMLACEMKSACEVMERQIKNQGRVSLARV